MNHSIQKKLTFAGVIISLGIVFGDIGTSPLYVMKAITSLLGDLNKTTIYGSISCVFLTLTLQTTIKYVLITLKADNKGEGGIFALFTLIRRRFHWTYIFAIVGGSMLLADGIITPSITVTSAIEGLHNFNKSVPVIPIVLIILSALFYIQQFGTSALGKLFGPIMVLWFLMLLIFGLKQVFQMPEIIEALHPKYAIHFLINYPSGFWLLGAVFLATTGAEALYSDLGHCGIKNIQVSWIFVKIALLFNYLGQGVWILKNKDLALSGYNPFFEIIPEWFLIPGIILATCAAIIASQALISGSFTLISEAISLNFWPKTKIKYPTEIKGQMYIPGINIFLWIACVIVVLYFQESSNMEAAYGLSISITMIMTTILLLTHLLLRTHTFVIITLALLFFTVEISFLVANSAKFSHGGWFTLFLGGIFAIIMFVWYNGRKIKNKYMKYDKLSNLLHILREVKYDYTIPKYSSNIVYISKSSFKDSIESIISYSLINKQPKRADIYWFLHIDIKDDPYQFEYEVTHLVQNEIIKIDFHLGFKIEPQINLYFNQVIEDLVKNDGLYITSQHPSLQKFDIKSDFTFITIERVFTKDTKFEYLDSIVLQINNLIKFIGISEGKALNLNPCILVHEKIPLDINKDNTQPIQRIYNNS